MTGRRGAPEGGRRGALVRMAEGVYRQATRILPAEFRSEYGAELGACFAAIVSEARRRSRFAVVSVTVRAVADLATRAPVEHLSAARAGALVPGIGLEGTWQDVRHAARRLRRRPSFAVASVLTLGLGFAAATTVFSLVHGVVLSPLPYPDSDRIVQVDHGGAGLGIDSGLGVTYGFYRFYAERARTAESMAMYSWLDFTLTGAGEPERLSGIWTTPSLGSVLGIAPAHGRWLAESDGQPGAALVVVLSDRLWRERFGGEPDVVGQSILLQGMSHEVVGVTRRDFAFPSPRAAFWTARSIPATGVGGWNAMAVARLAPGRTPADLEREMEGLLPALRETTDDPARVASYLDDAGVAPNILTLKEHVVGDVRPTLWVLLGTVAFVLLIALMNVANLFLVRAEESHRETAVRTALGAGDARLARGYLAETLILAGLAGGLGLALAHVGVSVLKERAPVNVPRLDEVGLDPAVLTVAAAAILLTAVILGLIPAVRRRGDLSVSLKDGAGRATAGRERMRGRNVLVATQVALAMVLLVASGLLFRTFQELRAVDPGFSERQALTFQVGLSGPSYANRGDVLRFHRDLLQRLESLPGVESAGGVAQCLPLTPHMCWGETLVAEGFPTPDGEVPPVTGARVATADYFATLGIQVRGRGFRPADESGDAPVAVISEATADAYFPDVDALGRRLSFGGDGPWYTVVGVAADVRGRMDTDDFRRVIYLPMRPEGELPPSPMSYVVRTSVPPASLADGVRRAVAELDPAIPIADVETLRQRIADATAPAAFALTLIGLAAFIALLLGAVGVYAVVAYAVSRRTAEIGVRMALGAAAGDVQRMVLRQGGMVVAAGIAAGLLAALALTRFMEGMLHGVSTTDPASYLALTTLMLAVATLAISLPARRASRVSPLEALNSDR